MRNMRVFLVLILVNAVIVAASGQSGIKHQADDVNKKHPYNISMKVEGWKDTTVFLVQYYGKTTGVVDTAQVDNLGRFVFEGDHIDQGVCFVAMGKIKFFDFVIGLNRVFTLETDTVDFVANMQVTGDIDNKLFFENLLFNAKMFQEADPYIQVLEDSLADEEDRMIAYEQYQVLNEQVMAHQNTIIHNHPETLVARLLKSPQPVALPTDARFNEQSAQIVFYKEHYFDNFDLADDALIRTPTPMYERMVKNYLDQMYDQDPNTIMEGIHWLVDKVKHNREAYKYMIWTCLNLYHRSPIMGLDETYVLIYEKYIASGEMDYWLDPNVKERIKENVDVIRLAQVGSIAHDLKMQDENGQPKRLYDIKNKYTALLFFDHNCGHCRASMPKLVEKYNERHVDLDFEIFAVDTDSTMTDMKQFIEEFETPWITVNDALSYYKEDSRTFYQHDVVPFLYLIENESRKIIAKHLPVNRLVDFLIYHESNSK